MSKVQFVRAGACTEGASKNTPLIKCALEFTDCPADAFFWSPSELAEALASEAATCLQAGQTNEVLNVKCSSSGSSQTTGSCLVEDFNAKTVYQCAYSKNACASGDLYLSASETTTDGDVTCKLCGLDSSMDYDLSDVTGKQNILQQILKGDDKNKQLEAAGIAGIVIGIVVGCGLLLCFQRMCRRCCGGRKTARQADEFEKPSEHTMDPSETKDVV